MIRIYTILCGVILVVFCSCNRALKKENEQLREELAKAQQYVPLKRDTIRDTVEVVTQQVIEVEKVKNVLSASDKELINDLKVKLKELESYQKMSTVVTDTVYLQVNDSSEDAPLVYRDAWCDFELRDNRMRYSVRDSLAIAVKKEYKHRLLWWRWGTKGYEVKVVNFNPHSTIKYNTFIKRRR